MNSKRTSRARASRPWRRCEGGGHPSSRNNKSKHENTKERKHEKGKPGWLRCFSCFRYFVLSCYADQEVQRNLMTDEFVKVTIDGAEVSVPKGTTIIEAAKQAGI